MTLATRVEPFKIPRALLPWSPGRLGDAIRDRCERLLAFPALNDVYARSQCAAGDRFCERVLRALDVDVEACDRDWESIPRQGPLVVVANHPFGGLDGVILLALMQRVRPDARLLANYLLARIPEMHESCLFVDPFGGESAATRNQAAMRSAVRWVAGGGALGVFPAGEVSHFTLRHRCVTDPPWSDSIARLALRTGASVVPVYFDGQNSRLFQALGLLHSRLRTVMLPRELLRRRGHTVRVEVGAAISPQRLARPCGGETGSSHGCADVASVTEYLRLRTYILNGRAGAAPSQACGPARRRAVEPIVAALPVAVLAAEVAALPGEQCLAASGPLRALIGRAEQIPSVVREIGRLRESTFRLAGEGTGRGIDLDRFDEQYLHLFVWHDEASRVIAAYRLGQTDELLKRFGASGLYTSTLFRYQARLLEQLSPALELGRSFVIPEHQRDYAPLLLLWKGIGRFVTLHPHYRRLIGAVSISDDFQSMTKQLLMTFLRAQRLDESLAAGVRPKSPPKARRFPHANASRLATLVSDLADVEELVGEIESNRRGVPVLLRHYLKLNAKLLGFNIDADFGAVVDGLLLVDLATVDRPILNRYMGAAGAATFLAFHGQSESRSAERSR